MRIFQSEKQVTVSIKLNAFGELFSAGEPFNSQSLSVTLMVSLERSLKATRSRTACQKEISGIHAAPTPWRSSARNTMATAAIARLTSQMTMAIAVAIVLEYSLYIGGLSFQERAYSKLKGDFRPKIVALSKS
mgnify:CR=1 FL=1